MRISRLPLLALLFIACAVERADDEERMGDDQVMAGPTKGQLKRLLVEYRSQPGLFAALVNNPDYWVAGAAVDGVHAEVFDDVYQFGLPHAGDNGSIIARLWYEGPEATDPRYGMARSTIPPNSPHLNKYYLIVGKDGRWQLLRLSGPPYQLAGDPVKEGVFAQCTRNEPHQSSQIQIGGSDKECTETQPAVPQLLDSHDWITCHDGCCSLHLDA